MSSAAQGVAQLAVAAVFLYSAFSKARHRAVAADQIRYLFRGASTATIWLVLAGETVAAGIVLIAPRGRETVIVGFVFVVLLSGYYALHLALQEQSSCSCFGVKSYTSDEDSLLAKTAAITAHACGNSLLVGLWIVASTTNLRTLTTPLVIVAVFVPCVVVVVGLIAGLVRVKLLTRREHHPGARSLTVETVRLGRCVRLGGKSRVSTISRNHVLSDHRPVLPLIDS